MVGDIVVGECAGQTVTTPTAPATTVSDAAQLPRASFSLTQHRSRTSTGHSLHISRRVPTQSYKGLPYEKIQTEIADKWTSRLKFLIARKILFVATSDIHASQSEYITRRAPTPTSLNNPTKEGVEKEREGPSFSGCKFFVRCPMCCRVRLMSISILIFQITRK